MTRAERKTLTRLELQLMQVIWRRGASTAGEVQEELPQPLAYTTVQTMLNILEKKAQLKRKLHGRAYVYSAAVTQAKATGHAVRDLVDRVFAGSSEDLVMSLIESKQIDSKTLARLSAMLNAEEKEE